MGALLSHLKSTEPCTSQLEDSIDEHVAGGDVGNGEALSSLGYFRPGVGRVNAAPH